MQGARINSKGRVVAYLGPVEVAAGDRFTVRRPGGPSRHVQIDRVLMSAPRPPRATYFELTRSGRRKGPQRLVLKRNPDGSAAKRVPNVITHWLSFRDGAWRMADSFQREQL